MNLMIRSGNDAGSESDTGVSVGRIVSGTNVATEGGRVAVGEGVGVSMFVGCTDSEGAGVSIIVGITGDAGRGVHAATISTNNRSTCLVWEIIMSWKKSFRVSSTELNGRQFVQPSTTSDALFHNSYTKDCYIGSCRRKTILKEKIMSNKNLRIVIRIIHLTAAATLGMYFYSPLAGNETLRLLIQFLTLPSILLTGIALWQQAYLNKLLNRNIRKSTASSARPVTAD
jgi:hypothetical protein